MFNIYLKNQTIHNIEYTLEKDVVTNDQALQHIYFSNFDVCVSFKFETKYWFSKVQPCSFFKFFENNEICDTYLNYTYKDFLHFKQDFLPVSMSEKTLIIIYGDIVDLNVQEFVEKIPNSCLLYIVKNNENVYKLSNINCDFYFIVENVDNFISSIFMYYKIVCNIKNHKFKYVMYLSPKITISCPGYEFFNKYHKKLDDTFHNDIIISNNVNNFIFCKCDTFEKVCIKRSFSDITLSKIVDIVLNDN